MDPDDQAPVNSDPCAGLDLLAHWLQKSWDTDDPLWRQVYMMAHENYIDEHRGYRINRMLHEDWSREVDIYLALGYRAHSKFELSGAHTSQGVATRTLYYVDRGEIMNQAPGTAASHILQYIGPICQFTRAEQRLLRKALDGLTDQQIAAELNLSLNTLKSTWRSIYDRVAVHVPYVLGGLDGSGDDGSVRGTEKRRGVLSFVESHPQELRPFLKTA
ncbi:MAG: LuxR C-terminal-related transcriptional regulator [Vicinamibacterales bacterium]